MWKKFISKCAEECGRSLYLNVQNNVEEVHILMCRGMWKKFSSNFAEECGRSIYLNVQRNVEEVHF